MLVSDSQAEMTVSYSAKVNQSDITQLTRLRQVPRLRRRLQSLTRDPHLITKVREVVSLLLV